MIRGTVKTFNPPILIILVCLPDIISPKNNAPLCFAGGSLGAYEAGAYESIYEFIKKRDEAQGIKGKAVFDWHYLQVHLLL